MTMIHENASDAEIGRRVAQLMEEQNVKQRQLARVLEIPDSGASRALKGSRRFTATEIRVLAEFFHVTADQLLGLAALPPRSGNTEPPAVFPISPVQSLPMFSHASVEQPTDGVLHVSQAAA